MRHVSLEEQLQQDLKSAMRAREQLRVDVIRMALAAIKNTQIAQVKAAFDAAGGEAAVLAGQQLEIDRNVALSDTMVQDVLAKEIKRRRESAEAYRKGARLDLVAQEEAEAAILEGYLPRQLTAEELRPLVVAAINELGAAGPAAIGKVMPALMQQFKGRADGKLISQIARDVLSDTAR